MQVNMTPEQVRASTNNKVKSIETLCKSMKITITAKQRIDFQSGMIETVPVFTDEEDYPIEKTPAPVSRKPEAEIPSEAPAESGAVADNLPEPEHAEPSAV